jgi:hypothetical protein
MMVALEIVLKMYVIASDGCEALWESDKSRISSWSSMSKSGKRCGDNGDAELHFGVIDFKIVLKKAWKRM